MSVVNDLVIAQPGIGHNSGAAPLAEVLVEETAKLKTEADKLIAGGRRAVVTDRSSAERATLLVGMMVDHCKAIEAARVARKQPYLDDGRTVDLHFARLRDELAGSDPKRLGGEAARVKGLVDQFFDEEDRKAEVARREIEEAAQRKAEEAAAAQRAREEAEDRERKATLAGDVRGALSASGPRLDAEIRERQLQEEARRLANQAILTRVAPIDTGLGVKAHRKASYRPVINDWNLAIRHVRKTNEAALREFVQSIYDRQVRAGARALPGADIVEDRQTIIRRA